MISASSPDYSGATATPRYELERIGIARVHDDKLGR